LQTGDGDRALTRSPAAFRLGFVRAKRRRVAWVLALVASGCLTATPPKTPNQREAERRAPRVVVPLPPDAGRTPRPASAE
jgi:hypothetical protein